MVKYQAQVHGPGPATVMTHAVSHPEVIPSINPVPDPPSAGNVAIPHLVHDTRRMTIADLEMREVPAEELGEGREN